MPRRITRRWTSRLPPAPSAGKAVSGQPPGDGVDNHAVPEAGAAASIGPHRIGGHYVDVVVASADDRLTNHHQTCFLSLLFTSQGQYSLANIV